MSAPAEAAGASTPTVENDVKIGAPAAEHKAGGGGAKKKKKGKK